MLLEPIIYVYNLGESLMWCVCGVCLYAGRGREGQQLKASLSHVESLGLHEAL